VPLPAVLGHEGAGIVEAVGASVTKAAPGDRVAMSYGSCGSCPTCAAGRPWVCHDFWGRNFGATRPDGSTALAGGSTASAAGGSTASAAGGSTASAAGESTASAAAGSTEAAPGRTPIHSHFFGQSSFASHAIATERSITKLDPDVPLEVVAPFGCSIQTGAGAVLNALRPDAGTSIAVFGTGTVHLSSVIAARVAGCTTIVGADVRQGRPELAAELGATHVANAAEVDAVEAIKEATGGVGADFSIDATGSPTVVQQAVYCTGPGGVCCLIGAPPFGTEVSLDINQVMAMGRTVRGIVEGESVPQVFLPVLIELWRQGRFPIDRIMTHYDFKEIDKAARDAEEGRVVKPVLRT
jgi:aryl-alcohol dehydrogenase